MSQLGKDVLILPLVPERALDADTLPLLAFVRLDSVVCNTKVRFAVRQLAAKRAGCSPKASKAQPMVHHEQLRAVPVDVATRLLSALKCAIKFTSTPKPSRHRSVTRPNPGIFLHVSWVACTLDRAPYWQVVHELDDRGAVEFERVDAVRFVLVRADLRVS